MAASAWRVARPGAGCYPAGPTAEEGGRAAAMPALDIELVPLLKDNYAYLLRDQASGATGVVDPSEAQTVLSAAAAKGWRISHVLNTHHHWDHTGGNLEIKRATGCTVVGPAPDRDRVPGIDIAVDEGERFRLGAAEAGVIFIPRPTPRPIALCFAA